MKRVLLLLAAAAGLLVSCDAAAGTDGWLRFTVDGGAQERNLVADTDAVFAFFEYSSEALFSLEADHPLKGETTWRRTGAVDGVSDLIGPFSQGLWRISVHACNREGVVLYTDTKDVYISASSTAFIRFNAVRGTDDGYVSVNIRVPRTTVTDGMSAVFDDGVHTVTVTDWNEVQTDGMRTWTGTVTLSPGSYVALFSAGGASEPVSVEVLPGVTASITGTMYPGEYEEGSLAVVTPDASRIHIEASGHWVESGRPLAMGIVVDEGSFTTATWYVNGTQRATGMDWTFTPDQSGVYEVVAYVYREDTQTSLGNGPGADVAYDTATSASWTVRATDVLTTVKVFRSQVIDAPASGTLYDASGSAVSFPYDAKVANLHADGRYTMLELDLHT